LATSTLIGARGADVVIFAISGAVALAAFVRWHPEIVLVVMDSEMARAVGLRVGLWDRALYVGLGFAIAFSLRVAGMVYTFGYLILPALVARGLCREMRGVFTGAPLVAASSSLVGFILANHYDLPPAHVAVGILVLLVALVRFGTAVLGGR
jgi:ABC-type Mn2+/Zn2+ transport system permease subunit